MTSFIRTAEESERKSYIEEILSRHEHFIPLRGCPNYAQHGDFIYLAYHGKVVGRAIIDDIESVDETVPFGSSKRPFPAKCKVHYKSGWQRPEPKYQPANCRGWQGIRYLGTVGLDYLDEQDWS